MTCTAKTSSWPLTRWASKLLTVVWDKDLQLPASDPLRRMPQVTVCEAALFPRPGAVRLLFPVCDAVLDAADPAALAAAPRPLPLAYAGNQYDRDEAFGRFFAPAAARFRHRVAGKWTRTAAWPQVNFTGRCPFPEVERLYRIGAGDRFVGAGTVRPGRSDDPAAGRGRARRVSAHHPGSHRGRCHVHPAALHAADGQQVIDRIEHAPGHRRHGCARQLIARCLERLSLFRLSRQVAALDHVLGR